MTHDPSEPPIPPVVLVGLTGAGKTSVARRLADRAGVEAVDLDEEIEAATGRRVSELFEERGEAAFREAEAEASRAVARRVGVAGRLLIAAGGGWMANDAARAALPDATIVWLDVSPDEAAARLRNEPSGRPLLRGRDVRSALGDLLRERLPAYREATYTVETEGLSVDEVAREVAARLGLDG